MDKFHLNRRQFIAWSAGASAAAKLAWAADEETPQQLLSRQIPSTGEHIPLMGIGTNRWISDGTADEQANLRNTLQRFFGLGGFV